MELTVAAMDYLLQKTCRTLRRGCGAGSAPVEDLRLEEGSVLCVCRGEERRLILWTGEEEPVEPGWYLLCGDTAGGCNAVMSAFVGFHRWRSELMGAGAGGDIAAVVDCAARYLSLDMTFVDESYRFQGISGSFRNIYDSEQMSAEQVKGLFENNPEFARTFEGQELRFYPGPGGPLPGVFYYNVHCDGVYCGRILISYPSDRLPEGLGDLIEQLMEALNACCRVRRYRSGGRKPHDVWRELLESGAVDSLVAGSMLMSLGWKERQRYQVLCLRPLGYLYDGQTMKYLAAELEGAFPACIVVYRDNSLFCLHNLSREEDGDFQGRFSYFLRENLFKCGVSSDFGDFYESRIYSVQAGEALSLGEQRDPSLWRYEYADYLYEAALRHARGPYPVEELCSPTLLRLLEFDEAHPELELAETLYQYISCRFNAVQAAEQLHIHRTTFSHRMSRLQQVAKLHLEDPREHLTVFLALSALREERQRRGNH